MGPVFKQETIQVLRTIEKLKGFKKKHFLRTATKYLRSEYSFRLTVFIGAIFVAALSPFYAKSAPLDNHTESTIDDAAKWGQSVLLKNQGNFSKRTVVRFFLFLYKILPICQRYTIEH